MPKTKLGRRKRNHLLAMIRTHDDPILHTPCTLADEAGRAERIQTMKDILAATDNGVGIAAPQCGFNDRVIVVHNRYTPWPREPYAMIDPSWWAYEPDDWVRGEEGCLSYPGIKVNVSRSGPTQVQWINEDGFIKERKFSGFDSIVIQHEIDHLDGICRVGDEWKRLEAQHGS